MKTKSQIISEILKFNENANVPFIIWNTAPFCTSICNIKQKDFYLKVDNKLNIQIKVQEMFPESILFPGPWPDFGTALEASMFGCKIVWHENDPPNAEAIIDNLNDVTKLKVNVEDSLLPEMLKQYKYMWSNIDKKYIEECGYLDGIGFALGPLEVSATIMGYTNFLMGLHDNPNLIHKLIDMATETVIYSLKQQEKINGKLKRVFIPDHMSHQVSKEMFEEYCFPYYKRIFDEFPAELKMYHNEGNLLHVADRVYDFGANVIHYSVDTKKIKEILNDEVVLMGNLDPINLMLNGNEQDVYLEALKCLEDGSKGGGMLLSTAGGMAPDTPKENVNAALRALNDFNEK